MTTMTRFVPFRSPLEGVAVLQNRLNSIFSDFPNQNGEPQNESLSFCHFIPPVDIHEDAHRLVLRMEVPGMLLAQSGVHRLAHTPHLSDGLVLSFFLSAVSAAFG